MIDYDPAAGTYKLTNKENTTVTVGTPEKLAESTTDRLVYRKVEGSLQHDIVIAPPVIDGVKFTYSRIIGWNILNTVSRDNKFQFHVAGIPTKTADMPKSGTGTYLIDGGIGANGFDPTTFKSYNFQPTSTGTFTIDFGAGSIQTALRLRGTDETSPSTPAVDFGTFTGSGLLTSGGPAFTGSFTSNTGGFAIARSAFDGAFFGPGAQEMNYVFFIDTNRLDVTGTVSGLKR